MLGTWTRIAAVLLIAATAGTAMAWQPPADWNRGDSRDRGHGPPSHHRHYYPQPSYAPYSYGQLQRPYPYHLDYYRMMYGGSYAPYFGNLYGPPVYQNFPNYPAYGGFGGAYYW